MNSYELCTSTRFHAPQTKESVKRIILISLLALFLIGNIHHSFSKDPCPFHNHADRNSVTLPFSPRVPICLCFWGALFLPCLYQFQDQISFEGFSFWQDLDLFLPLIVINILHPPEVLSV